MCFGSWHVPHVADAPLEDIIDFILQVKAGAYSLEAANPRHEFVSIATSRDPGDVRERALAGSRSARERGFEGCLGDNRAAWAELWARLRHSRGR